MYSEIHEQKQRGFKKAQAARNLDLDVKTVAKYWDMTPDEYAKISQSVRRKSILDEYEAIILRWVREFPGLSSAQVTDWLKENYPPGRFRERTVRRFVARLRKVHDIPRQEPTRQYEAVEELPPGFQMQVDFGQKSVQTSVGTTTKLYGLGAVLSHSRYKYSEWLDKPLTTLHLVHMLRRCFDFLGGVPEELVFDQDKLVAVSENHGDILYTWEFEKFKQAMGFRVRLCRARDPESKGKVEAVIKYLKRNFASHRTFTDLRSWNQSCLDWLERTGNQKVHGTTKKVPAKVFLLEKQYLRPVPLMKLPEPILSRTVRKDNTILFNSNRYSLPLGTYRPGLEVLVREKDDQLVLIDKETGGIITEHPINLGRGELIQNTNHLRNRTAKVDELHQSILTVLGNTEEAAALLDGIRKEKTRYSRDQFQLLEKMATQYSASIVQQAIAYCLHHRMYSAVDCRDAAAYFLSLEQTAATIEVAPTDLDSTLLSVKAEKRDIGKYTALLGGVC